MKRTPKLRQLTLFCCATLAFCGTLVGFYSYGRSAWVPMMQEITGKRSVAEAVELYGAGATARLVPYFEAAGVAFPPRALVFLATKQERRLEVWARDGSSHAFIRTYDIKKTSGIAGPKLREGDRQVPEGLYRIIGLNPNSSYHLSMKLNYPNDFDLRHATAEGRDQPGSNIFIHGKARSIGCLAMGDPAIEELFVLVEAAGWENVEVVIAPRDPRRTELRADPGMPLWTHELYDSITAEFEKFPYQAS